MVSKTWTSSRHYSLRTDTLAKHEAKKPPILECIVKVSHLDPESKKVYYHWLLMSYSLLKKVRALSGPIWICHQTCWLSLSTPRDTCCWDFLCLFLPCNLKETILAFFNLGNIHEHKFPACLEGDYCLSCSRLKLSPFHGWLHAALTCCSWAFCPPSPVFWNQTCIPVSSVTDAYSDVCKVTSLGLTF